MNLSLEFLVRDSLRSLSMSRHYKRSYKLHYISEYCRLSFTFSIVFPLHLFPCMTHFYVFFFFVRKFSYRHLAQIKFILPEAVQTDRILIHDEKTMCMKPDMKITLLFDVVEGHREQSTYIALHQEFDARLFNYFSTHPEVCISLLLFFF